MQFARFEISVVGSRDLAKALGTQGFASDVISNVVTRALKVRNADEHPGLYHVIKPRSANAAGNGHRSVTVVMHASGKEKPRDLFEIAMVNLLGLVRGVIGKVLHSDLANGLEVAIFFDVDGNPIYLTHQSKI